MKIAIGPSSFGQADSGPIDTLVAAGADIVPNPFGRRLTQDEITAHLNGVHGLIAGLEPLNADVLQGATSLKALARVGIGMDNVDADAARELGIAVSNTPDQPAASVAELTLTAMLALCRQLVPSNASMHAGGWEKRLGRSLGGANVLLIGYGRTGRRVADLVIAFGAQVMIVDPFVDPSSVAAGAVVDLATGLAQADIISLHASGRDVILDEQAFAAMRPGVFIVNSARGELVDERALADALDAGVVAGGWFDVFWQEPYAGVLTDYPQMLLTPHVGTYTVECRKAMEMAAVHNLLRDLGEQGIMSS